MAWPDYTSIKIKYPQIPWGPKLLHYITLLFRIHLPEHVIILHYRIGFELFPQLCSLLRWCKAYHVGSGLQCMIVFEKNQNCLQWGPSNLVDPAESPKIRLLNRDFGNILSIFPGKTAKHKFENAAALRFEIAPCLSCCLSQSLLDALRAVYIKHKNVKLERTRQPTCTVVLSQDEAGTW